MKLLIAGIAVLALFAFACNDDSGSADTLTLEQYFAELERIGDEAEEAFDEIDLPDVGDDASFEESRDTLAAFFDASAGVSEDAVDDIRGPDPPDEVEDEHDAFVDALDELPGISEDYADSIRDAETEDEYNEIVGGDDPLDAVSGAIDEACVALQQVADDNSIEVDLQCDE